jgi:hypothetical protein
MALADALTRILEASHHAAPAAPRGEYSNRLRLDNQEGERQALITYQMSNGIYSLDDIEFTIVEERNTDQQVVYRATLSANVRLL